MSHTFTYVEACAGIGGVSFGFDKIGGKCLLAAEYDPTREGKRQFAQEAYRILHPGVKVVGDVSKLQPEDVPDHDVMSFTTPCQSFSVAGKRGGFEDARGTVYFECMRLARAKRPKIIFMENVKGLVGHVGGKTLDTIVQIANDSGYVIDFNVMNSKFFDVAQNRERFFMIGVREDLIEPKPWTNVKGTTIVPKAKRIISAYEGVKTFNFDWPTNDTVTRKLRDFLEDNVAESYYLPDEKVAELIAKLDDKDTENLPKCIHNIYGGFKESKPRIFEECPTIRTAAGGGHLPSVLEEDLRIRKLTPLECLRLQSFTDGNYQALVDAGFSDTQIYKFAGNAVTVNVIEALGLRMLPLLNRQQA